MRHASKLILTLVVLCGSWAAYGETVYVTDHLLLGLYPDRSANGRPIKRVDSGTALEVLERSNGYARVRTPDGTEGWVKAAYLVTETPPRLQLTRLEKANQTLTEQLAATRRQLQQAESNADQLQQRLEQATTQASDSKSDAETLRDENRELKETLDRYSASVPTTWLMIASIVCLVGGLVGGYAWLDYRIRKRHGGIRIR